MKKTSKYTKQSNAIAPSDSEVENLLENTPDDATLLTQTKKTATIKEDTLMAVDKDKTSLLPEGISTIEELQKIYQEQRIEKKLLDSKIYAQYLHEKEVTSITVSPDGKYVISGSKDTSIHVFDIREKRLFHAFNSTCKESINCVAVSSDSKLFVAGTSGGFIEGFRIKEKEPFFDFGKVHAKAVSSIAISPDNKSIVTASWDKSIKVLNIESKQEIAHFSKAHKKEIFAVAITPNGRFIVSGCEDGSFKIFDLETKEEIFYLKNAHKEEITSVAISPDGKYLITGSNDKSIKMFDFKTRKLLHHFEDVHSGEVYSVAFSSNGRYIISGSNDDTIKVFDAEKKHQIHHIKDAHKEGVSTVAMSIDRRYIISGSNDKSVKIFCLEKKEDPINIKNAHSDWILSVAASPDGQYVLSGGRDSSIKVFDFESQKQIDHFKDIHEDWISSIAVTPDSQYVVSGSSDEKIKIHEIKGGKCVYDSQDKIKGSVFSVAISSDGKFVVCGTGSSSIAVLHIKNEDGTYNFTQPKINLINDAHEESVTSVTVSPDNKYIISGSEDKSIKIFDISSLKPIGHLRDAHEGFIHSVAVSPNGKLIASGSKDNSIKIFDMETKLLVCHFQEAHQGEIYSVTFSPDSKHVVSGSEDRLIKIFNILTQQQIQQFQASDLSITSVVFSLDGKFIISGSKDQCIKIFDVASHPQTNFFQDLHQEKITTFALSSKGKFIVSGSDDKYVKVTFLENKRTVQLEPPHELPITCVAISDNEEYAVSASQDKSIKIFNLEEKEQMAHIPNAHSEDKDIISSVAVTSDNKFIVSASFDMSIKIFDFTTQNELHTIPSAHQRTSRYITFASFSLEPITCLKITSENKYIITGSADKSIKGFDLSTQKLAFNFKDAHEDTISSIAISPNNRFIVSGSVDKSIKVFDLLKQRQVQHFKNAHTDEITSVNVSPDNKFIVSCSKDKSIKTHNITTGEQICHIPNAHSDEISTVCFSHDGLFIYSASADKLIRGFKTKSTPSHQNTHISKFDPLHSGHEIFYFYEGLTTNTVLNSVDDFLLQKDLTGPLMTNIATKSNFFILPYAWNILHISAIQNNHAFIKAMPSYFDFKVTFLLDYYHKTPLHYLVAHSKVDYISVNIMLAYICDYLQDCFNKNIYEFHQILQSLTPLFALILLKSELKLKEKFLNLAYKASPAPYNTEIPIFGEPKLSSACLSKAPVLTPQVQNTLWQEEGEEQVSFVSSFLHLDYNVISPDMQRVIRCLKEQKNEEVFKTDLISKLIDHLWDQSTLVLRMNFIIYSVFIIALSVYICLQDRSLPYEIVILVILGVFFMGEVLQILDLRKKYIKDPWNWLDITHLFLTTAFIIRRMVLDDDDLARKWIATIVIMLGYLRWVSYLRIFQSTRNLIQVIITVMKDMLSFIIIIALIIIGFSVIFLAFDRGQAYGVYLFNAYNVLYGPIDDNDTDEETPFNFSQKLLMCIIAFLLNVILLNLLISIMGDSYAKVLEKRDKTDSLTRLDMILEATASMKVFHKKHVAEKSYLVYCLSLEKEEDEVRQEDELEEKVTSIKRLLKKNEKRVEVIKEMTEQKINKLEQDVKENHDELKQKIQTNSELLKQMMETLAELKKNSNR